MREPVWRYTDPDTGKLVVGEAPRKTRDWSTGEAPQFSVKGTEYLHGQGYKVARQIPLHHPDAPRHDKMGRAVFRSEREELDFMRKTGATRDGASLEPGTESIVDERKRQQKILPHEEEWQRIRYEARKSGALPLDRAEPPSEQKRRAQAYRKKKKGK